MVDMENDLIFGILCWKSAYKSCDFQEDEYDMPDSVKLRIYSGYVEVHNMSEVLNLEGDPEAIRMQVKFFLSKVKYFLMKIKQVKGRFLGVNYS